MQSRWIVQSVPRMGARYKVTREARYVEDLAAHCMPHGADVRNPHAHGRFRDDQPLPAAGIVNHAEAPVVLPAHGD